MSYQSFISLNLNQHHSPRRDATKQTHYGVQLENTVKIGMLYASKFHNVLRANILSRDICIIRDLVAGRVSDYQAPPTRLRILRAHLTITQHAFYRNLTWYTPSLQNDYSRDLQTVFDVRLASTTLRHSPRACPAASFKVPGEIGKDFLSQIAAVVLLLRMPSQ